MHKSFPNMDKSDIFCYLQIKEVIIMEIFLAGCTLEPLTYNRAHHHANWELVIVTDGDVRLETKLGNFQLYKGDLYITPPYVIHKLTSTTGFHNTYIQVTDALPLSEHEITVLKNHPDILPLAKIILDLYNLKENGYQNSLKIAGDLLMQFVYDYYHGHIHPPLIREIQDYISKNYFSSITMQSLSEIFGYNGDYIRSIFKKEIGQTPLEYLTDIRMNQAKNLLQNMDFYSINEISLLCGFHDPLYFSRLFKKQIGMSPKEYRKNHSYTL